MKIFGVACFFLFALHAWAQNVIEIEFEKPIQATATQHKEIELHKPFGVPVNYTLRFKDFNRPNLNDKDTRQILQLIDNTGNPTENNLSKPFAAYNYKTDSLNTNEGDHILEVNIFIPNDYFRFDTETFNLSFSNYGGVNYSNLIAKATVSVQISCEHPEYYSITQWNKGIPENLEVVKAIQKEDHLLVYAHRPKDSVASTYKIRLRAHERFETTTSTQYSKATLGLINVPIKSRFGNDALTTYSQVSLSNLGLHFGLWNHQKHSYFANGNYTHQSWGIGTFILPSLQRVRFIKETNEPVGYAVSEPFQASFFGFGLTLNYAYNGLHFHLIPLAIDFQTSAERYHVALHSGKAWMGIGIGYTPLSWKK